MLSAALTGPQAASMAWRDYDFEPRIDHPAIFGLRKRCRQ
jgi:hypothetical protein